MSVTYSVQIHTDPSNHPNIRKHGFISCNVFFSTPPLRLVRMAFCLHCKQLLSYTGGLKHSKQLSSKRRIVLSSLFCPDKVDCYKNQIMADVELFCEKLSSKVPVIYQDTSRTFERTDHRQRPPDIETNSHFEYSQPVEDSFLRTSSTQQDVDFSGGLDQDPRFEQGWDYFEDCLLSRWCCLSDFNCEERFQEAETILKMFCDDETKTKAMQSRVVTLMFRNLSSHLSLTKSQNDQLVGFLKSMIKFISPENTMLQRKFMQATIPVDDNRLRKKR